MTEKQYRAALEDARKQFEDGLIDDSEYMFLINLAKRNFIKANRGER